MFPINLKQEWRKLQLLLVQKSPSVISVLRCLWNCSVRDGVRLKRCWKSSALCAHPTVNCKSGEAHLCYVRSPLDIKHHPSVSSSLTWCYMAQNHSLWLSLSTASELPSLGWWMESSSTSQELFFCWCFAVAMCLSSPFPSVKLEDKKVSKIYGRAAWKLHLFPTPHN